MKLHEYQSKQIFAEHRIPIPDGRVAMTAAEAKQIAQKLKNVTLTLKRKVTSTGKLYGALTEKVLAGELKSGHDITVAEDTIIIEEPIKTLGEYRIEVDLAEDTKGHFKVVVKEEK